MQSQQQNQCQSVRKLKQEIEKLDTPFTQIRRLKNYTVNRYLPILNNKLILMGQLKDKYAVGRMTVQSKKFIENNKNSIDNFMYSYASTYATEGVDGEMEFAHPTFKEIYDELYRLYDYVYSEQEKMCPCDA